MIEASSNEQKAAVDPDLEGRSERPFTERTAWVRNLAAPIREFIATENASAVVLLAATLAALLWANSPWGSTYDELWSTELSFRLGGAELSLDLRQWVNDGLMAFFFLVAGLEIRRELDMGELRERRRVATPVLAAVGGLVAPALIYLAFNAGEPTARGWGIPIGTDTAFALGVLALVGRRCPARIRVFLLTLVIVDDVGALTVVALAYTGHVSPIALLLSVVSSASCSPFVAPGSGTAFPTSSSVSACGSRCSPQGYIRRSPGLPWACSPRHPRPHGRISSARVPCGVCSASSPPPSSPAPPAGE